MAGQNDSRKQSVWRAEDGRVIEEGDILAVSSNRVGANIIVWVDDMGHWMAVSDRQGSSSALLSQWLDWAGRQSGTDNYSVQIVGNIIDGTHFTRPVTGAYHANPPPTNGVEVVLTHVLADLNERAYHGLQKYGTVLQTHNGRDALQDAYEEALDLVMYLKQRLLEEMDGKEKTHE